MREPVLFVFEREDEFCCGRVDFEMLIGSQVRRVEETVQGRSRLGIKYIWGS